MRNAITGAPVDRPPIWIREGFDLHQPPAEADDFAKGWQADPVYRDLWEFAREHCDQRIGWGPGGHFNRWLGIAPRHFRGERREIRADLREITTTIDTPGGPLTSISRHHRGETTVWRTKYPVESLADLNRLRALPFEVPPVSFAGYERILNEVGDTGVLCLNGAAARLGAVGDKVIIISYAHMTPEEAQGYKPRLIAVDDDNRATDADIR
ncbi:MAG: hypothetical protein HN380_26865 [Victivallales bacterium]|nr:hypothetical protein [Victivallales bacterium]